MTAAEGKGTLVANVGHISEPRRAALSYCLAIKWDGIFQEGGKSISSMHPCSNMSFLS